MTLSTQRNFLVPTWGKLILAGFLFFLFGWIIWPGIIESLMTDAYPIGFPFTIQADGLCPPTYHCVNFSWVALIGDLIVWYLVSATILRLFPKKT